MDIHDIIDAMRSDPQGISAKYGIPIQTVYNWCRGSRKPPAYVLTMMADIIILERRLKAYGKSEKGLESRMGADSCREQEARKESESENGPIGAICQGEA